ncbi:MAG: hypothetical protein NTX66_00140, partial [Candidatus Falkowbacteria bacterium]|nr:hypothetical protein [Candidatus Falkowbacteria bacterium]
ISLLESCLEGEAVDDLKNIEDRIPEALKSGKAHDLRNDNEDTEDKYGSLDFEGKLVVVKKTVN